MSNQIEKRKKRDTSRKREIILESAVRVFTKSGFVSASMDEIAETAGVSKRTIYNHFQSKDKLFQAIVADFIAERDLIKPIGYSKEISLEEQLRSFAQAELFLINDPMRRGLSRLLTSVFLMDLEYGKQIHGQYSPYQDLILWLESAKNDGKLDFQSSQLAVRVFYGLVQGCLTWSAMLSDGESLEDVDLVLDEIIAVFLSRYGV